MKTRKWFYVIGLLALAALVLAACSPETIVETVIVEVPVEGGGETTAPEQPVAAVGECCDTYRIGIFEDPLTTNYWSYLGPDSSVWTQYALQEGAASLYSLSDRRFDFIPTIALDLPPEPVQEGDFWTITVEMAEDAVWSDGTPLTANDVAFTMNACLDLQLTANWPNTCRPEIMDRVEAVDDYTVKFYFTDVPGLAPGQDGAAQGAILPEHFWGETIAEALTFIDGVVEPEVEHPADCAADDLSTEDAAACEEWAPVDEAFENARLTLYGASGDGQPSYGGYTLTQLEPGAFVSKDVNEGYYLAGAQITQWDDGTWAMELPNGRAVQLYGAGAGETTLDFTKGPYSPNIVMSIYGSQDAAFLALADGEIDYVINPLSLARGLREQAESGEDITTYTNPDNGLFYLAFNIRKSPGDDPAFREAVDILVDKQFVAESILQGSVIPTDSIVPPGNAFWFNDNVTSPFIGLTREERVNMAIEVLEGAGWSWTQKPAWDEDLQDVVPGEGLTMPSGSPMPEMTILGPGPAYDPQRATFNQWISEWLREMGMPVESELTGFNTILDPVFVDADFDMYILGWSLTIYPDYMVDFFHSDNDTAVSGNFNTPGLRSDAFDAAADAFLEETDITVAQEKAREMQQILADERPYIPLFVRQSIDLIRGNIDLPYTENLGGIEYVEAGFQTDAQVLSK